MLTLLVSKDENENFMLAIARKGGVESNTVTRKGMRE
jgi:hypothetical protein